MSSKRVFESLIAFQPYGNQGRFSLGEAVAKKRANKVKSSHSGSLDKKTKSAGSSPSTPKVKVGKWSE